MQPAVKSAIRAFEVLEAFERCSTLDSGKLGPAHAALEGRFDYGTLKCLLAELQ